MAINYAGGPGVAAVSSGVGLLVDHTGNAGGVLRIAPNNGGAILAAASAGMGSFRVGSDGTLYYTPNGTTWKTVVLA